jgi:hypothetical protein
MDFLRCESNKIVVKFKINRNKDVIKFNYQRANNDIVQYEFNYDKLRDKFTACLKSVGKTNVAICAEKIEDEIRTIMKDIKLNGKKFKNS